MTINLYISQYVLDRGLKVTDKRLGILYGVVYDHSVFVIGFFFDQPDLDILDVQNYLPGEVDLCGVFSFGSEEFTAEAARLTKMVDVLDRPVFLANTLGEKSVSAYNIVNQNKLKKINFEVYNASEIRNQFVMVRVTADVPILCQYKDDSVVNRFSNFREQVASGFAAFQFEETDVYLMGSDSKHSLVTQNCEGKDIGGISASQIDVGDAGSSGSRGKSSKKTTVSSVEILNVSMLYKATQNEIMENAKNHAPVIIVEKKHHRYITIPLRIDTLTMIHRNTKLTNIYEILVENICRHLKSHENTFCKQLPGSLEDIPASAVYESEPFHFFIDELGHFLTKLYPRGVRQDDLHERTLLHEAFMLPKNRPLFRRMNSFKFSLKPINTPLVNPHEGLSPSGCGGELGLVQGNYHYYHYMQQGVNDDGWGCAYRSLQTLCSWYSLQGYIEDYNPTHQDIQKTLVSIGDKPSNFIGSKKWIGSTEVQFCLESMFKIPSRIMPVSSGKEMATVGPELLSHFKYYGTPIMIGGGVLAHTIIGVDYNRNNEDIRFLILDPHYTGADDLHAIQSKGWCGWKKADFWKKDAFYNMCMPLVPKCI